MNRKSGALKYFRSKFNCAQSVLTVFGSEFGVSENDCLKIACPFGGGMGRQQYTCGAVTGALMVLGLKYGKAIDEAEEKKEQTYRMTREFFSEFNRIHGSTVCKDLLNGLDMTDPEDYKKIIDLKMFDINCERYISDAVSIIEKMIL